MTAEASAAKELRELGKVLQRIILGEREVDGSALPKGWAAQFGAFWRE